MNKRAFGVNKRGENATLYTFENKNGMVMEVTDFGATLFSLWIPTENGKLDVVLGYDDPAGYEGPSGTFFGATVGRNANRIGKASFVINGVTYQIDKNDNVRFLRMDFFREELIKEPWVIMAPQKDGSHLLSYTKDRGSAENNPAPVLPDNAITIEDNTADIEDTEPVKAALG